MGALSVANLKTNNRNFDNILDSYLNLVDGGAITGAVTFAGGNTLGDAAGDHQVLNGKVSIGATSAYAVSSATATSSTIAVTHSTNTPVPAISQPAGTVYNYFNYIKYCMDILTCELDDEDNND